MVKKEIIISIEDYKKEVTIRVPVIYLSLFMKSLTATQDPYKALKIFNEATLEEFEVSERTLSIEEWGDKMKQFKGVNRKIRRFKNPPKHN